MNVKLPATMEDRLSGDFEHCFSFSVFFKTSEPFLTVRNCSISSPFAKWSSLHIWYELYSEQNLIILNSGAGTPHHTWEFCSHKMQFFKFRWASSPLKSDGRGGVMFSEKCGFVASHCCLGNFRYEDTTLASKILNPFAVRPWDSLSSLGAH